jgi:hypothetical protein
MTFARCLSISAKDITSLWFADGKFLQESESQRMTNDFGGKLDFTDDADFLNDWRQQWNSVSSIKHSGGVCIVVFVATKYEMEAQDCVYDLMVTYPNGTVCLRSTNLPAVKQSFPPFTDPKALKPTLRLSPKFVAFQIDPPDPAGTYSVEVELRDRLRNKVVRLKKELMVAK